MWRIKKKQHTGDIQVVVVGASLYKALAAEMLHYERTQSNDIRVRPDEKGFNKQF